MAKKKNKKAKKVAPSIRFTSLRRPRRAGVEPYRQVPTARRHWTARARSRAGARI